MQKSNMAASIQTAADRLEGTSYTPLSIRQELGYHGLHDRESEEALASELARRKREKRTPKLTPCPICTLWGR